MTLDFGDLAAGIRLSGVVAESDVTVVAGWAELVEACEAFTAEVNARVHRVTRRPPVETLTEEQPSAARAARGPLRGGARGDPESLLELHGQLRRGDLLGPAHVGR